MFSNKNYLLCFILILIPVIVLFILSFFLIDLLFYVGVFLSTAALFVTLYIILRERDIKKSQTLILKQELMAELSKIFSVIYNTKRTHWTHDIHLYTGGYYKINDNITLNGFTDEQVKLFRHHQSRLEFFLNSTFAHPEQKRNFNFIFRQGVKLLSCLHAPSDVLNVSLVKQNCDVAFSIVRWALSGEDDVFLLDYCDGLLCSINRLLNVPALPILKHSSNYPKFVQCID